MKPLAALMLGGLLAASAGLSATYYTLELKGGSRLYSLDKPVSKGRVLLFHRYPDGVYQSLPAGELARVVTLSEAPEPEGFAPGQTLYVGPPLSGPGAALAPASPAPAAPTPSDEFYSDYGYYGWGWGGGYVPPPRPGPGPPTRIGPNGFPILAPPGSPGSRPPPIGPNGFPILAPQPPMPQPRQP